MVGQRKSNLSQTAVEGAGTVPRRALLQALGEIFRASCLRSFSMAEHREAGYSLKTVKVIIKILNFCNSFLEAYRFF